MGHTDYWIDFRKEGRTMFSFALKIRRNGTQWLSTCWSSIYHEVAILPWVYFINISLLQMAQENSEPVFFKPVEVFRLRKRLFSQAGRRVTQKKVGRILKVSQCKSLSGFTEVIVFRITDGCEKNDTLLRRHFWCQVVVLLYYVLSQLITVIHYIQVGPSLLVKSR